MKLVVLLWLPAAMPAQRGLSLGASAGLALASVHGADAGQMDAGSGFAGGVFASLGVSKRLGLEVDVSYAQKRSTMAVTQPVNGTVTYRFNYIEVPVLIRYHVLPSARVAPTIVLGLAPAFRLNSTRTSATWSGSPSSPPTQFVFPKATDVGVVFGAAVGLPTGQHRVRLDGRYTVGLTRFAGKQFTGTGVVENPALDLKNGALTVTASYAFNVAPKLLTGGP